jgi:shikimate dehydrogenase
MNPKRIYGLIGRNISHSFSQIYFIEKFERLNLKDYYYELFHLAELKEIKNLLKNKPEICGLNVTIPYKKEIIPYLVEIDETAGSIGAVNTIKIIHDNNNFILKGYNTDAPAFRKSLTQRLRPHQTRALVLGSGGASLAVQYVLRQLGLHFTIVSRSPHKENETGYQQLTKAMMQEYPLIINCTPAGMFPESHEKPLIPYAGLGHGHLLYDLVYNPSETEFLKMGSKMGAETCNGMEMLHLQADLAWEIWNR